MRAWNIAIIKAFLFGIFIIPLSFIFFFGYADAQTSEITRLKNQIVDRNSRLREIEAEIAKFESDLQKVGAEKQTLQRAINQLELERKKINADISYTQNLIGTTDLEISKLKLEIENTQEDISKNERAIGEILRLIDEKDSSSLIESLLNHDNLSEFWDAVEKLERVRNSLGDEVKSLASLKILLETKRTSNETKRVALVDLKQQYSSQEQVLQNNKSQKNQLLFETQNEESNYQALLAERKAAKEKFENELRDLEAKLQFTLDPDSIPRPGSGVLRWPLDDIFITQYFGSTVDSVRLYTSGTHNGMDFRAFNGTPVKAALAGKVVAVNIQVATMCQYGKWVLVRHANGLTTLYAHLSVVSVNEGDDVTTGKIVGYSGSTGYATGPHLHFTVYATNAVTFKQYTCNSGATLTIPVAAASGYLDPMDYLTPLE